MGSLPTAYAYELDKAVEGQLYDGDHKADSRVAYGSMAPGRLVVWHAGDDDEIVRLPTATGEVTAGNPVGVLFFDPMAPNNPYIAGDAVAPVRKGRVWVLPEEAVTPASGVFVRFATGSGGSALGAFRASADTATAVQLTRARWITSGDSTHLTVLEIDL
jgi:hypothetical protein